MATIGGKGTSRVGIQSLSEMSLADDIDDGVYATVVDAKLRAAEENLKITLVSFHFFGFLLECTCDDPLWLCRLWLCCGGRGGVCRIGSNRIAVSHVTR